YYAYNTSNGRWYTARGWRGDFLMIDDRMVPRELRRIPRNHWRNYPTSWEDRGYGDRGYRDHQGRGNWGRGYQGRDDRDRGYQGRDDQGRGYQGRDDQGRGYQ